MSKGDAMSSEAEQSDFLPGGTLRYKDNSTGEWVITSPHDAMYSTATMCATEWWDVEQKCWRKIFEDEP